jgi:hypothetical protein
VKHCRVQRMPHLVPVESPRIKEPPSIPRSRDQSK